MNYINYEFNCHENINESLLDEYFTGENQLMNLIPEELIKSDEYMIGEFEKKLTMELPYIFREHDELIEIAKANYQDNEFYLNDSQFNDFILKNEPPYNDNTYFDEEIINSQSYQLEHYEDRFEIDIDPFDYDEDYEYFDPFECEAYEYYPYKEINPLEEYYDSLGEIEYPDTLYYNNENHSSFHYPHNRQQNDFDYEIPYEVYLDKEIEKYEKLKNKDFDEEYFINYDIGDEISEIDISYADKLYQEDKLIFNNLVESEPSQVLDELPPEDEILEYFEEDSADIEYFEYDEINYYDYDEEKHPLEEYYDDLGDEYYPDAPNYRENLNGQY